MRQFVRVIYILGLFLTGGGALCYILIFISLDGFGEIGLVETANDNTNIEINQDSLYYYIDYTFSVDKRQISNSSKIWKEKYHEYSPDTLIIKYNRYLPTLNYIEEVPIERRSYKLGAVVFSLLFLFFCSVWNFSNREKWFKMYGI